MKVYFHTDYVAAGHCFDTTRKSAHLAESLMARPIKGIELQAPEFCAAQQLARTHDPEYVRAVQTGGFGCDSQGFTWDPGIWLSASRSTGGVIAAAKTALVEGVSGSLSSGLHHARYDRGAGFCTFNGLAVAANSILELIPTEKSVLILDTDAHAGGGTFDLIHGNERIHQSDVYVSAFDCYAVDSERHQAVYCTEANDYLSQLEAMLNSREPEAYGLLLYNAGMDVHEDCTCGGLNGINSSIIEARERMVFEWARSSGLPIAFVLAGGYTGGALNAHGLTALHRLTIEAAVEAPRSTRPWNTADDGYSLGPIG